VLGAGGLATGGAFVGTGETRPERDKSKIRDFRPSGYALLGVGGALMITGAVLLGVDRARAKRAARGRARMRVIPAVGPENAVLQVRGRF
jgi:hypothetical protein